MKLVLLLIILTIASCVTAPRLSPRGANTWNSHI